MADEEASVPSIRSAGSVFALFGPSLPEWRKIIRITGDAVSGFKTEVVSDRKVVKAVEEALELADEDDAPQQQQLLMTAWQAVAMYLSSCDDEDKAAAMNALKVISNLMGSQADGPSPEGTFGATMQTAATEYSCVKCERSFGTEAGLISHLANLHKAREKQTKATPANDRD